mgnify:FL=1
MKKTFLFSAILIMFLLTACGSADNASPAQEAAAPAQADKNSSAGSQADLAIAADPIRITTTLDSTRQVEALIPVTGGTLSATAADGTVFRLDIPASALVTDALIRMTPVSQIDSMPFGSQHFAVQLEPEGQQFFDFVTLTIAPAQELPLDQQLFFGYQGSGENFALAAPVVDSTEIKLQLLHFSGYGVTKGLLADIEPVRARIGGTAEARLQSAIAEELTRARQQQLLGAEDTPIVDFENYFQQYTEQVIKPRVAAAGESCAAGRLAIQTVLGYERQRQLLGIAESSVNPFDASLMDTVANVCLQEEFELCRDEHIIHRIIPVWLGLERQHQLLGITGEGSTTPALEKAKEYVRRCLTFELQFQSQATFDDGGDGGYNSAVESKVKIQFDLGAPNNAAQAPLVNTAFEFIVPGCSVTSNRGGSTFDAYSLVYIADTKSPNDELGYVRDFKLSYFPGSTTETYTVTCDEYSYTSPPEPLWSGAFLVLHEAELDLTGGGFVAEGWEILGDEYFAKKEWIKEDAGLGLTEAGTFKLYHKPQ